METRLKLVTDTQTEHSGRKVLTTEQRFRHFRRVMESLLQDAQDTWGDIWQELQGELVEGAAVHPHAKEGFQPRCGWPEFLERMWILKHYLDHAKRFSQGKP